MAQKERTAPRAKMAPREKTVRAKTVAKEREKEKTVKMAKMAKS